MIIDAQNNPKIGGRNRKGISQSVLFNNVSIHLRQGLFRYMCSPNFFLQLFIAVASLSL